MDHLRIKRADFLGWSDGGITGLDLAMRYPERVRRVVAFGANPNTRGTHADAGEKPAFKAFLERAQHEYGALSPTPGDFAGLDAQLAAMYSTQPDWTDAQLRTIRARVLIIDGRRDPECRAAHPARHQPLRIPAEPARVQRRGARFPRLNRAPVRPGAP